MDTQVVSTVPCSICGSLTHEDCIERSDSHSSEAQTSKKVRLEPKTVSFKCSIDCMLGATVTPNSQWSRRESEWIEKELEARWEATWIRYQRLHKGSASSAVPLFPFDDIQDNSMRVQCQQAFLQLRYEGWQNYFEAERLQHAHPLLFVPSFIEFQNDAIRLGALELLSSSGQAKRLCAMDPRRHPVGSLVVLPDAKLWKDFPVMKTGESNSFCAESRDLMDKLRQQPKGAIKIVAERRRYSCATKFSGSPKKSTKGAVSSPNRSGKQPIMQVHQTIHAQGE